MNTINDKAKLWDIEIAKRAEVKEKLKKAITTPNNNIIVLVYDDFAHEIVGYFSNMIFKPAG